MGNCKWDSVSARNWTWFLGRCLGYDFVLGREGDAPIIRGSFVNYIFISPLGFFFIDFVPKSGAVI